jgi:hypothetical protein
MVEGEMAKTEVGTILPAGAGRTAASKMGTGGASFPSPAHLEGTMKTIWKAELKKKLWIYLEYTEFGLFVVDYWGGSKWLVPGTEVY